MAGEFVSLPLDDLVEDIIDRRGVTPIKLGSEFTASGHRVISAKLIKDGEIDLNADEPRFVDEDTYRRWMRTPIHADDVILTSEAPLGEVAYVREPLDWCVGQRLFCIRPRKDRLHGRFLYYALQSESVRHDLQSRATGTTAQGIRQSELRRVRIPILPIGQQHAIAGILGALDDKIDLNRRTNATLEAMARALFKSWFVDFDPVRAKAERRDPGLPEPIANLFADTLKGSDLGEIPTGWGIEPLGNLLALSYGKALKGNGRRIGPIPVFGSNGQIGWHDEKLADGPAVIVGRKGNPGVVTWAPTDFFAIDTTFYVLPTSRCPSLYFLFYALQEQDLGSLGADSAVPGLNRTMAYLSRQTVPPHSVLGAFDGVAGALFERRYIGEGESRTLAELRDALLPRLMSGELRVPKAERMLEAALA